MFLYSLLALAVVTALIFAAPLKAKVWATLAVVAAGALWASATAVGVLAGGHTVRLWATGRLPLRKRRWLDGPSFGAVRADRLGRGRRRGALLAGISRALPRTQIPGPHLAALHRAGDDVLRHAGRSDLRRRIFIPLFLGADDRRIVPADPGSTPSAAKCAAPRWPT